jgi:hypothetical protein
MRPYTVGDGEVLVPGGDAPDGADGIRPCERRHQGVGAEEGAGLARRVRADRGRAWRSMLVITQSAM